MLVVSHYRCSCEHGVHVIATIPVVAHQSCVLTVDNSRLFVVRQDAFTLDVLEVPQGSGSGFDFNHKANQDQLATMSQRIQRFAISQAIVRIFLAQLFVGISGFQRLA
ncbi:hypothetical protein Dimus_036337 [Dionaea muscipula]